MYKKLQNVNNGIVLILKINNELEVTKWTHSIFNFLYRLSHSVLNYLWGILLEGISVF